MATLPSANVSIDADAGALAGGTGYCVVMACVARNADTTPRVFASAKALIAQHEYASGVSYVASHIEETKKPVLFVGLPIATPGTVGRQDGSGVTGSCVISVTPGPYGYLEEVDASVRVLTAGTIGTPGITFALSLDGGLTEKTIRLGDATTYTIPYVGIVLNFAAGTLAVDDEYTFTTTPPMWDADGIAAARTALAAQQKLTRSWMVIGDVPTDTVAGYVVTEANAYKTSNERFTYARINVRDRLPLASMSRTTVSMTGAPTLTFAEVGASGDTITRSSGSWITDGFAVGMVVTVAGSAGNNVTGPIAGLTATVITLGTTDLNAEGPVSNCTVVGSHGLTFAEVGGTGDTITRSGGSWLDDGFRAGDVVTVAGTASNNVSGALTGVTATVLTFGATDLNPEVIGSRDVTVTKGETMAAWVAAMDAEFESVDAQPRIDIALGRGRKLCPLTKWSFRRPAAWHASIREYQKDIHVPCWRKEDGPLDGVSLEDADGNIVEFDERLDGGALAGRFTCLRTWGNGPNGAFVAMSLTRDTEGSLLSYTHNIAVANIGCTIVQKATENAVGKTLQLDSDGHATAAALGRIEESVNTDLEIALLQEKVVGEGPRASKAVWRASTDDDLSVVDATLTGVLDLVVNGTIVHVDTVVRIS
jgi:hypothetical protein